MSENSVKIGHISQIIGAVVDESSTSKVSLQKMSCPASTKHLR